MSCRVQPIVDFGDLCGEGVIWDYRTECLIWTDIPRSTIHFLGIDGVPRSKSLPLNVSAVVLNGSDGWVICGPSGLFLLRENGSFLTLKKELPINDMIVGPGGIIYAGTIYWGGEAMERPGELIAISPDTGAPELMDDGIQLANGLGFSPDNRTLYFTDSAARKIYAYDVNLSDGSIAKKRTFVTVPSTEGIPDGLTVDSEGFVWSAQWYGSQVVRYDPDGKAERRITLPVTQVSSVAFGGTELDELYITTAADSWRSALAPPGYNFNGTDTGGPLFRVRLDVQGKREHMTEIAWPRQ